jgi:hypothetical protein
MQPIRSEDGETREFLVIPPPGEWFDTNLGLIAAELDRRFPNMKFTLTKDARAPEEKAFQVIPILGAADGVQPMLKWPSIDVVEDVLECLAGFMMQSETKPILH